MQHLLEVVHVRLFAFMCLQLVFFHASRLHLAPDCWTLTLVYALVVLFVQPQSDIGGIDSHAVDDGTQLRIQFADVLRHK